VGQFRRALDALYDRNGTIVMGVLNMTPDSFFDGGRWQGEAGLRRFDELIREGAGIVDIGGESTRPGAKPVPAAEQIERIEPVLRYASARHQALLTVDTTSVEVAEFALKSGAAAINDVSCLADRQMAKMVSEFSAGLIIMHARGPMYLMPGFSSVPEQSYTDVVLDVRNEWVMAREMAIEQGLCSDDIVFDPGIGFWKSARHSLTLLQRIGEFAELHAPIVVGPSRKSFLTLVGSAPPEQRLGGSIAACLHAARNGVYAVRVHDVLATRQALALDRILGCNITTSSCCQGNRLDSTC
jgi:dihydropteroate synthase